MLIGPTLEVFFCGYGYLKSCFTKNTAIFYTIYTPPDEAFEEIEAPATGEKDLSFILKCCGMAWLVLISLSVEVVEEMRRRCCLKNM